MFACTAPRLAHENPAGGRPIFDPHHTGPLGPELVLRCGRCLACRLSHSELWAIRCEHELGLRGGVGSFLTLSFRPDLRPRSYADWRAFGVAFRKDVHREFGESRLFGCGERGDMGGAPHFHFIHFGVEYADRVPIARSKTGALLYRSALLERLWPHGHVWIGDVTPLSIRYVCRYSTKKMGADASLGELVNGARFYRDESGVLSDLPVAFPIFCRKPALGAGFVGRFGDQLDVGLRGRGGVIQPTPRQYLRELSKVDPGRADALLAERAERARSARDRAEETLERCEVRDEVLRARMGRKLERM